MAVRVPLWKTIIGIGTVIGVFGAVWKLDNHWATCDYVQRVEAKVSTVETIVDKKVEEAGAQTAQAMRSMQQQIDLRNYDLALESVERDIESNCDNINDSNRRRCEKYDRDREKLKQNRNKVRDSISNMNWNN